ncbi:hypothetical protein C8R44DRAFT_603221 [Mycena epipterygia]|nr:hypothetical protein C8R44DRAFT_603221 [Mycena epipterygia]
MTVSSSPTHLDFLVEFKGNFSSLLRARRYFSQGDTLAALNNCTPQYHKTYTSVQCGKGPRDNIELNCDIVYVNHSCEPNVAVDISAADRGKWHVRALTNIEAGSALSFFYPSTEWEMVQAFECECGAESCLGRIQGAKFLTREQVVARGCVSPWIEQLMGEREWIE